jgi:hypothetical protein
MNEDRVNILDDVTHEVVDECYGPTATGCCPRTHPDGVVCCAGRRIAPTGAGPEYWMMWVPPGSPHCPLAWDLEYVGL